MDKEVEIIREILELMKNIENARHKHTDRLYAECQSLWKKCGELQKRIEKLESEHQTKE